MAEESSTPLFSSGREERVPHPRRRRGKQAGSQSSRRAQRGCASITSADTLLTPAPATAQAREAATAHNSRGLTLTTVLVEKQVLTQHRYHPHQPSLLPHPGALFSTSPRSREPLNTNGAPPSQPRPSAGGRGAPRPAPEGVGLCATPMRNDMAPTICKRYVLHHTHAQN